MLDKDLTEAATYFYNALLSHLPQIIYALIILVLGWWLAKLVDRFLNVMMKRRAVDITVALFISKFIYIAIITFTVIAALSQLGVQTDSVVALIAGSALAVGLALRNSLSNLAAGILLIAFRPPFKVGDVVEISGQIGQVIDVRFLFTIMQNFENKVIAIPNNVMMNAPVINYWAYASRTTDISIIISYEADLEKAKAVMQQVIENEPRIEKEPKPFVAVNDLKDIGVSIFARISIKNPIFDNTVWAFKEALKLAFDANQIEIAHRVKLKEIQGSISK
ncbi:MAG: small-conductance mechanosensitive channel [Gammaproteobacteria bacterium]|jgi:small conductance mechanosensitive channel|nr:small-conductance mechanosensitive channel [Gammaproteobacteria bacterium]